jgi:hypothetical protein
MVSHQRLRGGCPERSLILPLHDGGDAIGQSHPRALAALGLAFWSLAMDSAGLPGQYRTFISGLGEAVATVPTTGGDPGATQVARYVVLLRDGGRLTSAKPPALPGDRQQASLALRSRSRGTL